MHRNLKSRIDDDYEVVCVVSAGNVVGESAVWCDRQKSLFWVDIGAKRIHQLTPLSGRHQTWDVPDFPTSIGLCQSDNYVLGLRHDVVIWNGADEFAVLATPEPAIPENRLNEGRVGPDGCFWVGTMQDNLNQDGSLKEMNKDSGAIYRVHPSGQIDRMTANAFGITNTFIWQTAQPQQFVTADTLQNQLYQYDYSLTSGEISNRQPFTAPFDRGLPDGSCLDAEGYIWNCRVAGGGCVVRFSPAGEVDRVLDLPCSWPTSCAFGGDGLRTLFVTSARIGLRTSDIEANPIEGGLLAVDVCVPGVQEWRFAD